MRKFNWSKKQKVSFFIFVLKRGIVTLQQRKISLNETKVNAIYGGATIDCLTIDWHMFRPNAFV